MWMSYSVVCSSCVGGESVARGVLDVFDYICVVACLYPTGQYFATGGSVGCAKGSIN